MKTRSLKLAAALLTASGLFLSTTPGSASDVAATLSGKVFDVTLTAPDAKGEAIPDHLVFDGMKFESTGCRPYGFTQSSYTAEAKGDAILFDAKATSPTDGTNVWKGSVRGDRIEGTLTWTNAKGKVVQYNYAGKTAPGSLDGRRFEIQLTKADGTSEEPDQLIFAAGGFESTGCRTYGFMLTSYATTTSGDAIRFESVAISPSDGKTEWSGTVRGDQVDGLMKWTNLKAVVTEYRFLGKRAG